MKKVYLSLALFALSMPLMASYHHSYQLEIQSRIDECQPEGFINNEMFTESDVLSHLQDSSESHANSNHEAAGLDISSFLADEKNETFNSNETLSAQSSALIVEDESLAELAIQEFNKSKMDHAESKKFEFIFSGETDVKNCFMSLDELKILNPDQVSLRYQDYESLDAEFRNYLISEYAYVRDCPALNDLIIFSKTSFEKSSKVFIEENCINQYPQNFSHYCQN